MKPTSTFKLNLHEALKKAQTRQAINQIGKTAVALLDEHKTLEIDFENIVLTPSIADGVIGALAQSLGLPAFNERIKMKNLSDNQKLLLKHVIIRRLG
ncbi:MAG: STAS-like domain-containing protein [Proteobacteria bacterium]|nr:STAS-like domain-containing protein [Pseudomonadota bacterium]